MKILPETDWTDDKLGLLKPVFANMGELARMHPEELVIGLLRDGFTTNCYDGQFFFDPNYSRGTMFLR